MKPMRHAIYIACAALIFCGCSTHRDSILKELDVYKAEFTEWPVHVPTDKTADAPLTGNGDIGLTMKTAEEGITFFIGKNDFWRALQSCPEGGLALPGALLLSSDIISTGVYHAEQLPGSAEIRATYTLPENELSVTAWVSATDNKVVVELVSKKEISLNLAFLPTEDGPAGWRTRGPAGLFLSAILTAGRKNCRETLWSSPHRRTRNSGLPGFDTDYV